MKIKKLKETEDEVRCVGRVKWEETDVVLLLSLLVAAQRYR